MREDLCNAVVLLSFITLASCKSYPTEQVLQQQVNQVLQYLLKDNKTITSIKRVLNEKVASPPALL